MPPPARARRRKLTAVAAAGALAVVTVGWVPLTRATETLSRAATHTPVTAQSSVAHGGSALATTGGGTGGWNLSRSSGAAAAPTTRSAIGAEQTGVVDITTVLDYGAGRAAGTGIVLTASGEILTNNHVIDEATAITATVTATGARYPATVVGTDPTDDVAVLQLSAATGLATAPLATAAQVAGLAVGDAVTALGNAGGKGGTPTAATGSIVALDQDITAGDDSGANPEQLTGLIETDAAIEPGDSGGPLEAGGKVVGIDTAAAAGPSRRHATQVAHAGYAIPVTTATAIAERIVAGRISSTIHRGYPAFLGVQVNGSGSGAEVSGVVRGSPAAVAGIEGGDTITAIDATAVDDATALSTALNAHKPHDRVRVTWLDPAGGAHTATITLATGPAD